MYRSILVPLDGSKFGEEAVAVAAGLARKGAGAVHLVTVLEEPGGGRRREGSEDHRRKAEAAAQAYLNDVADRLVEATEDLDLDVTVTVLPPGLPAVALAKHIRATGAGLVVMTSHGHGPLSRVWLGSTTDRLLRESPRPILVVRPSETEAGEFLERPFPVGSVVLPLDGSREAETVLPDVPALADPGARVTLVRALSPYVPGAYPYLPREEGQERKREREHESAKAYLEDRAADLRGKGFDVRVATQITAQPASVILEEAARAEADLIVMATARKAEGLRGALGSVADKVVRGAEAPVLIVRRSEEDTPAS